MTLGTSFAYLGKAQIAAEQYQRQPARSTRCTSAPTTPTRLRA